MAELKKRNPSSGLPGEGLITHLDPVALAYHQNQWKAPKQSTIHFENFLCECLKSSTAVVDLACGAGAPTAYFAARHPNTSFRGLDYSDELTKLAGELGKERGLCNLCFEQDDWFDLRFREDIDGVMSLQTLSWLPSYEIPLVEIFSKLRPRWVGLSSLFYEGDITVWAEIEEFQRGKRSHYNTISIPHIRRICAAHNYYVSKIVPFEIDIDLPKPATQDLAGTYTRRALKLDGTGFERMQISGPYLMNWRMILIERA